MAEGKKSFVLYADYIHTVRKMDRDKAGLLFLTILEYVNDLNPVVEDIVVDLVFEPIKQQMKRDLKSWEEEKTKKSIGGREGNLKKHHLDLYNKYVNNELSLDEAESVAKHRKAPHTDKIAKDSPASTAVNVNDNVNVTVINNSSPLQDDTTKDVKIIDYVISDKTTYEEKVVKQYHSLFCQLNTPIGGKLKDKTLLKANMSSWVKDLGLMIKTDKRDREELLQIYQHLKSSRDRFWANTVSSMSGVRKNFDEIMKKVRAENNQPKSNTQQEPIKIKKNESKPAEHYN